MERDFLNEYRLANHVENQLAWLINQRDQALGDQYTLDMQIMGMNHADSRQAAYAAEKFRSIQTNIFSLTYNIIKRRGSYKTVAKAQDLYKNMEDMNEKYINGNYGPLARYVQLYASGQRKMADFTEDISRAERFEQIAEQYDTLAKLLLDITAKNK